MLIAISFTQFKCVWNAVYFQLVLNIISFRLRFHLRYTRVPFYEISHNTKHHLRQCRYSCMANSSLQLSQTNSDRSMFTSSTLGILYNGLPLSVDIFWVFEHAVVFRVISF